MPSILCLHALLHAPAAVLSCKGCAFMQGPRTCQEAAEHVPHIQEAQDLVVSCKPLLLRPVRARRHRGEQRCEAAAAGGLRVKPVGFNEVAVMS
jgi:hypothetical protein